MLFFLLFAPAFSKTVYRVQTSGLCDGIGSRVVNKAECEARATELGFSDTTASPIAFSGVLPGGCTYTTTSATLNVYDSGNSNQCSDTYQCICEYTADTCLEGLNQADCICGSHICSSETGMVCASGTCSHAAPCQAGLNREVCQCGSTDCTPAVGLDCSAGTCSHANPCEFTTGKVANSAVCQCGTNDCVLEYCVAASGTCRAACAAGSYVSTTGCQSCAIPGYFCPTGATQSPTQFACPVGTYSANLAIGAASACDKCPVGRSSDKTGVSVLEGCRVCGVNMYQDELGMGVCKGCPNDRVISDTHTDSKHDSPDDCQINIPTCLSTQYIANNTCHACRTGNVCDGSVMALCPAGSICRAGTKTPCPSGKYGEDVGSSTLTTCIECAHGMFQNIPGQTYCARMCPVGAFGNRSGAISQTAACHKCPKGHACATIAMVRPVRCTAGTFQDSTESQSCKQCERGKYTDIPGSFACKDCGRSVDKKPRTTDGMGSNSVTQCVTLPVVCDGAKRPNSAGVCENCPSGYLGNGGTRCLLCPAGRWQALEGQNQCDPCPGCTVRGKNFPLVTPSFNSTPGLLKRVIPANPTFNIVSVIVYASLAAIAFLIVCTHRLCPESLKKLDLLFSSDHTVEDTHASRVFNTRLGASFTLSLPFIVAIIAVFVFTAENVSERSTLVPASTMVSEGDFQQLNLTYSVVSGRSPPLCGDIVVESDMSCKTVFVTEEQVCHANTICDLGNIVAGSRSITVTLPDNMQVGRVVVVPSAWAREQTIVTETIVPSRGSFVGTTVQPTTCHFALTRCKKLDWLANETRYGVKITRNGVKEHVSETGTSDGYHVVAFLFDVDENFFVRTFETKQNMITQCSTILTLVISVLSVMHIVKLILENCIDYVYGCVAAELPTDIRSRKCIMGEQHTNTVHKDVELPPVDITVDKDNEAGGVYTFNNKTFESKWVL